MARCSVHMRFYRTCRGTEWKAQNVRGLLYGSSNWSIHTVIIDSGFLCGCRRSWNLCGQEAACEKERAGRELRGPMVPEIFMGAG